jgi:hypothetical protein
LEKNYGSNSPRKVSDTPSSSAGRFLNFFLVPVSTNPGPEVSECTKEVNFAKVWSEGFHEVELGVGALPEHKVAEALFP